LLRLASTAFDELQRGRSHRLLLPCHRSGTRSRTLPPAGEGAKTRRSLALRHTRQPDAPDLRFGPGGGPVGKNTTRSPLRGAATEPIQQQAGRLLVVVGPVDRDA